MSGKPEPDPVDPFARESIRLWRVLYVEDETGEVHVGLTPEGWGWLHTLDGVSSNGTYGDLLITVREDVAEHDA